VVGTVARGARVLTEIERLHPDIITLGDDPPDVDALSLLRTITKRHPHLPVIMISTADERGASRTLEALAAGAADHITRPPDMTNARRTVEAVRASLIPRIKAICERSADADTTVSGTSPSRAGTQRSPMRRLDIVAIGASTGGPNALTTLLSALPADFSRPIVVTQHMPPVFTRYLAQRLDDVSDLHVREARHGDLVEPGVVLLAPGDVHLTFERTSHGVAAVLDHSTPVQFNRPSIDVMLRSVASVYGGHALAVVLTGMGRDGVDGCAAVKSDGAVVLVQDQSTSVVWGMPGAIHAAGLADQMVPIEQMAQAIMRAVRHPRVAANRE
jgi:two-component system, chemotaxis family, protein-glutamate methylesterase/glutaminase